MDSPRAAAGRSFERHHLKVYHFFLRMTGRHDVAQDLTQDLFVRVVRAVESYEEDGRELAWIFRIARNLLRDQHRQVGRRVVSAPLSEAAGVLAPDSPASTHEVDRAIAELPDTDREVFLLLDTVGLSYEELATVTGLTVSAVKTRLYRARRSLAETLSLVPARPHKVVLRRIDR
jgi:RNA polymerase sigma-70 factor, ECF subfamily